MPEAHLLIAAALAAPKTHVVLTRYANGSTKRHETASASQAENFAIGERRKVGRDLIDRTAGGTVRVASVEIEEIGGK